MWALEGSGFEGKTVILVVKLLVLGVDQDLERWRRKRTICRGAGGRRRRMGMLLRECERRRNGVEIGRDAAAFFSDLCFGFLLMHQIHIRESESLISQQQQQRQQEYDEITKAAISVVLFYRLDGVEFLQAMGRSRS